MKSRTHRVVVDSEGVVEAAAADVVLFLVGGGHADEDIGGGLPKVLERMDQRWMRLMI